MVEGCFYHFFILFICQLISKQPYWSDSKLVRLRRMVVIKLRSIKLGLSLQEVINVWFYVCFNIVDETCKPGKRHSQGPGDDISDIEHLLDNQPISEFTLGVHLYFYTCLICSFNLSLPLPAPKAKRQKQDVGVVKRLFNAAQVQESKVPSLSDDITPPSSPEHYEPSHAIR